VLSTGHFGPSKLVPKVHPVISVSVSVAQNLSLSLLSAASFAHGKDLPRYQDQSPDEGSGCAQAADQLGPGDLRIGQGEYLRSRWKGSHARNRF
jgi:hypothetical protein